MSRNLVVLSYSCPTHGRWDAEVDGDRPPDLLPCPLTSWSVAGRDDEYGSREAAEESCRARRVDLSEVRFETQRCADTSRRVPR